MGFRFAVGAFKCMVVSDGTIRVPGPPPPGSPSPSAESGRVMDVSCLLIEQGPRRVLVDTGCGGGFQASAGKLVRNLGEEGIKPADIDTIVYTHGHVDHVGGTYDAAGNPVFPRARQVVTSKEWACWERQPETAQNERLFSVARKNLLPVPSRFELVEDNAEVIPGVRLVPAPGHTLGSVMIRVSSGKDELLCIGDLIHDQSEFTNPGYYSFLDSAPEEAVRLRTEGLAEVAASGVLVFACHFPFPGLGHITQSGGVLGWQPVPDRG